MSARVYEIRTPENVHFHFERAGLASRGLAWAIDVAVMAAIMQVAALLFSLSGLLLGEFATALLFVAMFAVQWWYAALTEWLWAGRTVGKWAMGLRTLDAAGLPLTLYQATVRNLLRVVDFLPGLYLVGGVTALLDPSGRRLGDMAAATLVVREGHSRLPARTLVGLDAAAAPSADVLTTASRVSPAERDAVLALCLRRDSLPLPLRGELFEQLARTLTQRHGLPRPPHVSAEKLILQVAHSLGARSIRPDRGRATQGPVRDQES